LIEEANDFFDEDADPYPDNLGWFLYKLNALPWPIASEMYIYHAVRTAAVLGVRDVMIDRSEEKRNAGPGFFADRIAPAVRSLSVSVIRRGEIEPNELAFIVLEEREEIGQGIGWSYSYYIRKENAQEDWRVIEHPITTELIPGFREARVAQANQPVVNPLALVLQLAATDVKDERPSAAVLGNAQQPRPNRRPAAAAASASVIDLTLMADSDDEKRSGGCRLLKHKF
jgi:hypothetical protein